MCREGRSFEYTRLRNAIEGVGSVQLTLGAWPDIAGREKQVHALIHAMVDFYIFPDRPVVRKDVPATIHNISLIPEHRVSFAPFFVPDDTNIRPKGIIPIKFTPDETGEVYHQT